MVVSLQRWTLKHYMPSLLQGPQKTKTQVFSPHLNPLVLIKGVCYVQMMSQDVGGKGDTI